MGPVLPKVVERQKFIAGPLPRSRACVLSFIAIWLLFKRFFFSTRIRGAMSHEHDLLVTNAVVGLVS